MGKRMKVGSVRSRWRIVSCLIVEKRPILDDMGASPVFSHHHFINSLAPRRPVFIFVVFRSVFFWLLGTCLSLFQMNVYTRGEY